RPAEAPARRSASSPTEEANGTGNVPNGSKARLSLGCQAPTVTKAWGGATRTHHTTFRTACSDPPTARYPNLEREISADFRGTNRRLSPVSSNRQVRTPCTDGAIRFTPIVGGSSPK